MKIKVLEQNKTKQNKKYLKKQTNKKQQHPTVSVDCFPQCSMILHKCKKMQRYLYISLGLVFIPGIFMALWLGTAKHWQKTTKYRQPYKWLHSDFSYQITQLDKNFSFPSVLLKNIPKNSFEHKEQTFNYTISLQF